MCVWGGGGVYFLPVSVRGGGLGVVVGAGGREGKGGGVRESGGKGIKVRRFSSKTDTRIFHGSLKKMDRQTHYGGMLKAKQLSCSSLCSYFDRAQKEMCTRRSGRPGLPAPNSPFGFCGRKATLDFNTAERERDRAQGLCESRGGRPGLPVPNSPYGLCRRKATLN